MPQQSRINDLSSSVVLFSDTKENAANRFKWYSIKKFIVLAFTYSSVSSNFDIFSKVIENVRTLDFVVCEVTVGMTYMCMDFFIKQYTRKIDTNQNLNPLLKGITYGILLQSALWSMLHVSDVADSIRFLASNLFNEPSWTACKKITSSNITCVPPKDIIMNCRSKNFTLLQYTPAHINYVKSFRNLDQNVLATRFFASALVWIFNFFFTAMTDETLVKMFKMIFLCQFYSTLVVLGILLSFSQFSAYTYFSKMVDINAPPSFIVAMDHVTYAYGIGFIGVYDFGTLSPYTMVDNAAVLFAVLFTFSAFARSLIVKVLHVLITNCVKIEISLTPHYFYFAVLPLSTEFLHAHKLYVIYIYVNIMLTTVAYLAMVTLSMSKLLQSEFQSVKILYIVGILCFLGFSLSLPITAQSTMSNSKLQGLKYGIKVTVLYLGGFKVAVVMWIYGVQRFCTDIQFWLGFKPTKFWIMCWMFLPVVLFSFCANRVYLLIQMREEDLTLLITAFVWIAFSFAVVVCMHIRTVVKYIMRNNLARAFTSNSKYGPPDLDDRKRRRAYNETVQLRQCRHNCNVLDETFDCNHLPLMQHTTSRQSSNDSNSSIVQIFQARQRLHSTTVETLE